MTTHIIACQVFEKELSSLPLPPDTSIEYISMKYHLYPDKLSQELHKRLHCLSPDMDQIILAFGLCGGATRGLSTQGRPLILPRVHDCIPLLLGSLSRFQELRQEEKGTFYLSHGWLQGDHTLLAEYDRVCQRHGEKKAAKLWRRMYDSYRRILHIAFPGDDSSLLLQSRRVADLLELPHQICPGNSHYLKKLVYGPWDDTDFIHLRPGMVLDESYFPPGQTSSVAPSPSLPNIP